MKHTSTNAWQVSLLAIFTGWVPVLKLAEHQSVAPASGIHNMWTGTYTINEYDPNARLYTKGSKTYKSSIVDKWSQYYISAVSFLLFLKLKIRNWKQDQHTTKKKRLLV